MESDTQRKTVFTTQAKVAFCSRDRLKNIVEGGIARRYLIGWEKLSFTLSRINFSPS